MSPVSRRACGSAGPVGRGVRVGGRGRGEEEEEAAASEHGAGVRAGRLRHELFPVEQPDKHGIRSK